MNEPLDAALHGLKPPGVGTILSEDQAFELCFAIALRGIGRVSPNPLVGSVILDSENRFLGCGAHEQHGHAHAEANVLDVIEKDQLTARLKGAKVFVSLEPCAHEGKTPSCAKRLAKLPIAEVHCALIDPNPLVAGKGLEILRNAGIKVVVATQHHSRAQRLAEIFLTNMLDKRPFCAVKIASTIDGTVGYKGKSKAWITNTRARDYGHFLRNYFDAILIGRKTLEIDDPYLSARHPNLKNRDPIRIVLDPKGAALSKELSFRLLSKSQRTFWVVSPKSAKLKKARIDKHKVPGLEIISVPTDNKNQFRISKLLDALFAKNIHSVLVEGGPTTVNSFLTSGLVDKIYHFQAPIIDNHKDNIRWQKPSSSKTKLGYKVGAVINLDDNVLIEMAADKNERKTNI